MEKGEPNRELKTMCGTGGSPKEQKFYGDRGIIVPKTSQFKGRIPVNYVRNFSSAARSSSTVSTDGVRKLQKIS